MLGLTQSFSFRFSRRFSSSVGSAAALQIAPNAAAAYSLRDLNGGNAKVVRVRRASDNHEQDFTAGDVSSGRLTDFVNAQLVAPLDLQELSATGRDGNFVIAKAAYSLRSLGTRQATVAATGDTVARANGKYVVQVRRSSDDAVKSFTAAEVTDGTLLAFTNADYAKYTSDFSSGDDSWGSFDDVTETGNIDGIGGLDNNLRLAIGSATSTHRGFRSNILLIGQKINFSARVFIPSTNSAVDGILIRDAIGNSIIDITAPTQDEWVTVTANDVTVANAQLRINLMDGSTGVFTGNGSDVVYLREVTVTQVTSDGLVKTWYDQSVTNQAGDTATGNHATQDTPANQPKVVKVGVLVDKGIHYDGTTPDGMHLEPSLLVPTIQNSTVIAVSTKENGSNGYIGQFNRGLDRFYIRPNIVTIGHPASNISITGTNDVKTIQTVTGTSGGLFTYFKDGTSVGTANYTGDVGGGDSHIGSGNNGSSSLEGILHEIIVYHVDQTDNRTATEANIAGHYDIDLPSGVDSGFNQVDGFVETWYDQSGNSRDSTQTTAARQPIIVEAGVFQDGLKFTHADTTNGKRLFVPRSQLELGDFGLVWVGKVTESDTSFNNLLGGLRGVQSFSAGTTGIAIKSSDGTVSFISEETTTSKVASNSSTSATLNEDFVAFATYEDQEAGPELSFQVDAGHQFFSFGSGFTLSSAKDIGIMNATGNSTSGYRTQESPTGICREVLVYDTHQGHKRVALIANINNHYNLF